MSSTSDTAPKQGREPAHLRRLLGHSLGDLCHAGRLHNGCHVLPLQEVGRAGPGRGIHMDALHQQQQRIRSCSQHLLQAGIVLYQIPSRLDLDMQFGDHHATQACCTASMLVAWCHASGMAGQLLLALPVLLPASCRYGPDCDGLPPGPCTAMTRLPPRTHRGQSNPDGKQRGGYLQPTLDLSQTSHGLLDQPHHKGSCLSPGPPGLCRAQGAGRSLPAGAPPPRPRPVLPAAQASVSGQASGSSELDDGVCHCSVRGRCVGGAQHCSRRQVRALQPSDQHVSPAVGRAWASWHVKWRRCIASERPRQRRRSWQKGCATSKPHPDMAGGGCDKAAAAWRCKLPLQCALSTAEGGTWHTSSSRLSMSGLEV